MMKVFYKTLVYTLVIVVLNVILYYSIPPDKQGNMSAMLKKKALLKNTTGERLIILGGSSAMFGFDSKEIEKAINKPVINLGLHAGLGLDFLIGFVADDIHQGDVVVISPEYNSLFGKVKASRVFYLAGELDSKALKHKSEGRGVINQVKSFVLINKIKVRRVILGLFSKGGNELSINSIDERGDILVNDGVKPKVSLNAHRDIPDEVSAEVVDMLNDFSRQMSEKGAKVYLHYTPLAASEYVSDSLINQFDAEIRKKVDVKFLSTPSSQKYSDTLFFDTNYHLNRDGRKINTEKFIQSYEYFR